MAKIIFWVLDAPGHVNPALALAKRLALRGHDIHFISGSTMRADILSHGFTVEPPPFDAYYGPFPPHTSMAGVVDSVRSLRADLVLCDVLKSVEVLVCKLAGHAVGTYSVTLPIWSDPIGPPVFKSFGEPRHAMDRAHVRLWWWLNGVRQWRNRRQFIKRSPSYAQICEFVDTACDTLRLAVGEVSWNSTTGIPLPYFPAVPTLIMCPHGLDFPRKDEDRLFWIDPCILKVRPTAAPLPPIDDERPLIFASLGSQPDGNDSNRRWFEAFCDAVQAHPKWQAIVAVGSLFPQLEHRSLAGQIAIVPTAAQHLALEKASVAAIHGGLNSVKECIMAEVPMVLFPTRTDQFGNAERLKARRLGLAGTLESSPAAIGQMLDDLISNPEWRERLHAVASAWRQTESDDLGARAVESILEGTIDVLRA